MTRRWTSELSLSRYHRIFPNFCVTLCADGAGGWLVCYPHYRSLATGQLSTVDGMSPSPSVTAGAVEHFAVIGKVARLGTINRAAIVEPIAPGRRRGDAHDQMTPMLPSINVFGPSCRLSYTGYTVSIAAS